MSSGVPGLLGLTVGVTVTGEPVKPRVPGVGCGSCCGEYHIAACTNAVVVGTGCYVRRCVDSECGGIGYRWCCTSCVRHQYLILVAIFCQGSAIDIQGSCSGSGDW